MHTPDSERDIQLLHDILESRWLAVSHFLLTFAACLILYVFPGAGLLPLALSAAPFVLRLIGNRQLVHQAFYHALLLVLVGTAIAGYWAAYDVTVAWMKLRLILAGTLLFYAISTQPKMNLVLLVGFWFFVGVSVATYFLFTADFESSPAKFALINQIGLWWMSIRPTVSWPAIQPTDTAAGISIITSIYGLYFVLPWRNDLQNKFIKYLVLIGLGFVMVAIILATSRGAFVALITVGGIGLTWLILQRTSLSIKEFLFPILTLLLISFTGVFLTLPHQILGSSSLPVGNILLSRMELIQNSFKLVRDFPFIGGGLGSFPGLFSQYILVTPYYSVLNSHNLFVDVMIEQGVLGGIAYMFLLGIGIWKISSSLNMKHAEWSQVLPWSAYISIFVAALHGMVDDYLYSGWGSALILFPVGMSILVSESGSENTPSLAGKGLIFESSEFSKRWVSRVLQGFTVSIMVAAILGWVFMGNKIAALWFANIGAVKMAKIDLADYPTNQWNEGKGLDELLSVEVWFERSLEYNASNRLANHRLGLIKMLERDFNTASHYLMTAYDQDTTHRGVVKNLGYSFAWLGEMEKAQLFLERLPESKSELEVYTWWWGVQGRDDLAINASALISRLTIQPTLK